MSDIIKHFVVKSVMFPYTHACIIRTFSTYFYFENLQPIYQKYYEMMA